MSLEKKRQIIFHSHFPEEEMEVSLLLVLTGSWLLRYKRWGSEQV